MIATWMMRTSVVILILGMLFGIDMGMRNDFQLSPAHAHLNLIGGVLMFLFGLFYRLNPTVGATQLAKTQGILHIIGAILFPIGIAVVLIKGDSFVFAPIFGSLVVLIAMVLFAIVVFKATKA